VKTFRSVAVLKHPRDQLWTAMRDHLQATVSKVPDLDSVKEIERIIDPDGTIRIVNEWRPRQQIPAALRGLITGEIGWIDRNSWDERTHICNWVIEPFFFADRIECTGATVFETALGGNGAKVTFEGALEIKIGLFGMMGTAAERPLVGLIESIVTTIIPRNLRAVLEAAAAVAMDAAGQPSKAL
jgi:hypothetical protein